MKQKNILLILAATAIITGALYVIPVFAQEPEAVEPEWVPPCSMDGEGPWWLDENAEPPCIDPETGEFTPMNPDCDGDGPWWMEEGATPPRRGGGYGKGRGNGRRGGGCRGTN